jgi:cytosine/adenosine deaminase-related metal-dependent hydrolase
VVADIVSTSELPPGAEGREFQVDLLLPGFINAHSHLEYTLFHGRLPRGRIPFGDWIDAIAALKKGATGDAYFEGVKSGVAQLLAGGTTTVIDSAHSPEAARGLSGAAVRYVLLWEILGLLEDQAREGYAGLHERLALPGGIRCINVGVNPHAPYSIGPYLRGRLKVLLKENPDLVCAWHLNETAEEMELFETGGGDLAGFLQRHELPLPFDAPPRCSPLEFLGREQLLDRCDLAFHLNHFRVEDASQFAAPCGVVHCPGTHAFFDRPPFPAMKLISAGANLCLGTDSLASATTLNMFDVVRCAGRAFPALTGPQLLDLATRNPARLRPLAIVSPRLGIIEPGAAADFAAIRMPAGFDMDMRELLLVPEAQVAATFIAGEKLF